MKRFFLSDDKRPKNKVFIAIVVQLLVFRKIYIIFSCVFLKKGVLIFIRLIHLFLKDRQRVKNRRFCVSEQTSLPKARVFTEIVLARKGARGFIFKRT